MEPASDGLVGRTVDGRYTIVRPVARGAMGRVYEARQEPLGQRVALKVLDVRGADLPTDDIVERFRREASSLVDLRSPATVRILDYGWWEGHTWLAMEFVDGITLRELVIANGPLSPVRTVALAVQIAESLQEAHAHELVHRDLKPGNVLVERVAGEERVKVIDWGLVKELDTGDQTDTGLLLGTPSWMSPEQIRSEDLDGRADQYALGCLLYFVLTGKKPFEGKGTVGLLYKHLEADATAIRKLRPEVPAALAEVVRRCMAKHREDRFANTDDLVEALRRVQLHLDAQAILPTLSTANPAPTRTESTGSGGCLGAAALVGSLAALGAFALAFVVFVLAVAPDASSGMEGDIVSPTTWSGEVRLAGPVFVVGTTLTIEPGTVVYGEPGSALVVTRGAQLVARGTSSERILFTSSKPAEDRAPGDWGGVVLLGGAPIRGGEAEVEGVDPARSRGLFGGRDPGSSCGVLDHVDIVYAGFELQANNELNGLTLGGCGNGTIVRDVAIAHTLDDGVELFGGAVDLERIQVLEPGDDGLDIDRGWSGRAQFVDIQMGATRGDNALEVDGDGLGGTPVLANVTLVGARDERVAQRAMLLQEGARVRLQNVVAGRFGRGLVDARGNVAMTSEDLRSVYAFDVGATGDQPFDREEGEQDDDGGFDEGAVFGASVVVGQDVLGAGHVPMGGRLPPGARLPDEEFWDQAATHLGAHRPGEPTWLVY